MGFFKFLKRDSKQGNEAELDLPPVPPPLEGFEDDKDANLPEFPQIDAPKEDDFKFDFPEYDKMPDMGKEEDMPEFPDLGGLDEEPTPNMNMPQAQKMVPSFSQAPPMPQPVPDFNQSPQMPSGASAIDVSQQDSQSAQPAHQAKHREHMRAGKAIRSGESLYVRVDKFKTALDHISAIRGDLRKSEEDVMKLESLKHEK
ncbi:MAG: hypothetical protein AABX32_04390, partial [Nanoarchaeota archaeon]